MDKAGCITFSPWPHDLPPSRMLAPDEVELWAFHLELPEAMVAFLARDLDHEEVERARRLVFPHDRRRLQVAHGVLRRLLGLYTGIGAREHRFVYGPRGKPRLAAEFPVLQFNLAHAGDFAIVAFAHMPVGVDLEAVRPVPEMLAIAGTMFAPSEYATLITLPEEKRLEAFLRCWTRKEAYVKALGDGLSLPLDQFTVSMRPEEPARIISGEGRDAWALYHLAPSAGYVGALAAAGRHHRRVGWLIEAELLRAMEPGRGPAR